MSKSKVYFQPVTNKSQWNDSARKVLTKIISDQNLKLDKNLVLKIHSGQPGNDSFIHPKHMNGVIDFLEDKNIKPVFCETNQGSGPRSTVESHNQVAKNHDFTRIPFVIGDKDGYHLIPIKNGKHFKNCKIAKFLADAKQVLVISHFKGHCMTGFGGAIKMLALGYASAHAKGEIHAIPQIPKDEKIDWQKAIIKREGNTTHWNQDYVYTNIAFMERMAEYALAARKRSDIHLIYATNLVANCDCDGHHMEPIYDDLGIFASTDPVAIDKAMLDTLDKREGKATYWGREVFDYGEKLGLGSQSYELITI